MHRTLIHRLAIMMGLLVCGLCIYMAIGTVIALKLTAPAQQVRVLAAAQGPALQRLDVPARDGLRLAGWSLPAAGSRRGVLLVHGLNSCSLCEFDDRFPALAADLNAAGYNILMIDLRGHGQSANSRLTMGEGERWDVLGGADWLHQHGSVQVAVLGVSLGAVSAVRAALEPDGPQAIQALVLDSCFGDFGQVLDHSFTADTGIPSQLLPGILLVARLLTGVDLARVRPIDELPRLKTPLLIMYGTADRYVTAEQQQAMLSAAPGAQTWVAADAEHARLYTAYHDEYVARVTGYLAVTLH